jgi:hypothetical protein
MNLIRVAHKVSDHHLHHKWQWIVCHDYPVTSSERSNNSHENWEIFISRIIYICIRDCRENFTLTLLKATIASVPAKPETNMARKSAVILWESLKKHQTITFHQE